MTGLLADLRESPVHVTDWDRVRRVVALLIPGAELSQLAVSSGGRVAFRGKARMGVDGVQYIVGQLEGYGERREDGMHCIRLGAARRRDEADMAFYDRPFQGWIHPNPEAVAAWVVGILAVESPHSPRRVRVSHDWTAPNR